MKIVFSPTLLLVQLVIQSFLHIRVFLSHPGVKVHLAVMDVVRCVVIAAQEHLEFLSQTEGKQTDKLFNFVSIIISF